MLRYQIGDPFQKQYLISATGEHCSAAKSAAEPFY